MSLAFEPSLARRAAAPVFALALFSSAALIFMLQPMFARMVTPLLGGSPAVWNTSMAFFQAALLIGYLYAHALARLKDLRAQAAIHAVVLALAFLVLPVRVSDLLGAPSSEHPALWLVAVLTLSVGAPFAAASATAPLLQSWYARTGRADAHDPYYLYAASNLGSFVGLLAYPILIEPLLGARAQSADWTGGYVLVAVLICVSAAAAISAKGPLPEEDAAGPAPSLEQRLFWVAAAAVPSALSLGVTLHISTDVASAPMLWVAPLALYLATFVIAFARGADVVRPWVIIAQPFAIALLLVSYSSRTNWPALLLANLVGFFLSALVCHMALARARPAAGRLTEFYFWVSLGGVLGGAFAAFLAPVIFNDVYEYPLALAAAALFMTRGAPSFERLANASAAGAAAMAGVALLLMALQPHHAVLVFGAVGCAAALVAAGWSNEAQAGPLRIALFGASAIAGLCMVLGALNVGSIFVETTAANGDAQVSFASPWNYVVLGLGGLLIILCLHSLVRTQKQTATLIADAATGVAMPAFLLMIMLTLMGEKLNAHQITALGLGACAIGLFLNRLRPIVMSALVLTGFGVVFLEDTRDGHVLHQERSFFGVLKTIEYRHEAGSRLPNLRVLMHGTTIHGAQLEGPDFARIPLTYYNSETALGEAILAGLSAHDHPSLALIGLGAGSTACLTGPQDKLTIFEIDPSVVRLSNSAQGDFTFVPLCQPNARVSLGDARLRIAREPNASFDVIVVDAFSSDAVPTHLLTREALALYLEKAGEDGIVILHLSNRNLALVSEASRVAQSIGAHNLWRVSPRVEMPLAPVYGGLAASVMIVAKNPATLARLRLQSNDWKEFAAPPGRPWSDDYVNLMRALMDSLTGVEECRTFPYVERCNPPTEAEGN